MPISLNEAKKTAFVTSTRSELRAYAEELGIEHVPANADAKTLRRMVCRELGVVIDVEGVAAPAMVVKTTQGGDAIFPSYNLTPDGIWGGRRHRMSLPRPEGAKMAQAEGFAWNGKHTYYIPYDEPVAVPEPIYNIIVQNKRRRPMNVPTPGGELGERTTEWEFDNAPMHYIGLDPDTKDRAGSLLEWYQSRGTEWFANKTFRQLGQIAAKLEVRQTQFMGSGVPRRPLDEEELRGRVMEFLFGYADAEADENKKIAA